MLYFEVLESSSLISFAEILRPGHDTYTFHGDTLYFHNDNMQTIMSRATLQAVTDLPNVQSEYYAIE